MSRIALLAILPALYSCAPAHPMRTNDGQATTVLALWVPGHPRIPNDVLYAGCAYWEPMGVHCVPAASAEDADVVVRIIDEPCSGNAAATRERAEKDGRPYAPRVPLRPGCTRAESEPNESETFIVGASHGGRIDLFANCFASSRHGKLDLGSVHHAMAHEIGHELGIAHVPAICGDPCIAYAKDADGEPICGTAVMNPSYAEPDHFTPVDAAAFSRHRREGTLRRFRW